MKRYYLLLILFSVLSASAQNNPPVAVNDTVRPILGTTFDVKLLSNDFDPDGDSVRVIMPAPSAQIDDSTWRFSYMFYMTPTYYDSVTTKKYILIDEHGAMSGQAAIVVIWQYTHQYEMLDVNNVSTLISSFGNHFWDGENSRYEVPNGTGMSPIFNHTVWVGGESDSGIVYAAGEFYRQVGIDFLPGPVSTLYDTSYTKRWNRVWKLSREEVDEHRSKWSSAGYVPIDAIADWPAHGDTDLGQTALIAPFHDTDLDGVYDPWVGDYPLIRGDQAIFFVMNDDRTLESESLGLKMKIEIHGMAYAFDQPEDSALNNMIFMHYDILNRSDITYYDTYTGLFCDMKLGKSYDDYIGCDVSQGMYYVYNADSVDGNGEPEAYGAHPPAFGLKVIGGPYLEPDGEDNPSGQCDQGLNGLNFGDQIADNERMGLSYFIFGWPDNAEMTFMDGDFYKVMTGIGYNGESYMFGDSLVSFPGWGGPLTYSEYGPGPSCRYFFPGDSDTLCNYGTYGLSPQGGYNQDGHFWTDSTCGNEPGYRRGVGSVGPFTFHPGEKVPLDYCFLWARDYQGNHHASVQLLRERMAGLQPEWNNLIQLPVSPYSVEDRKNGVSISMYPNPVTKSSYVVLGGNEDFSFYLYTLSGVRISEGCLKPGINPLDLSYLAPGIYLLKCAGKALKVLKL